MVTITFPDPETEQRAAAVLLGRLSGRVLRSGEHLVPEAALEALADRNIPYSFKEKSPDERTSTRGATPAPPPTDSKSAAERYARLKQEIVAAGIPLLDDEQLRAEICERKGARSEPQP